MVLLSSSSLVVVVAAVVVVVRRRHDVYYELRRREKMRPKNAALNLEPIPEREKRGKKIRAFLCVTKERITVCVYFVSRIDDFCAHHHHAKSRETVKVVADPSSSFSSFSAAGPVFRFSEVRSFSNAFSLDVINYPL